MKDLIVSSYGSPSPSPSGNGEGGRSSSEGYRLTASQPTIPPSVDRESSATVHPQWHGGVDASATSSAESADYQNQRSGHAKHHHLNKRDREQTEQLPTYDVEQDEDAQGRAYANYNASLRSGQHQ